LKLVAGGGALLLLGLNLPPPVMYPEKTQVMLGFSVVTFAPAGQVWATTGVDGTTARRRIARKLSTPAELATVLLEALIFG
jgi:hypothetical protein